MSILIDVFVVLLILIFALIGYKKGFVKSIFSLIALALTFLILSIISRPIAGFVYDVAFEKRIQASIEERIDDTAQNGADRIWEVLPGFVTNTAENSGVDKNDLAEILKTEDSSKEISISVSERVVKPAAVPFLAAIVNIALFPIVMLILKLLSKPIFAIFKIPVLKTANGLLGMALGLFKGLIIAVLVCSIIKVIVFSTDSGGSIIFTRESIENSVLFNLFSKFIGINF